jgi:hypothetical protein
MIQDHKFVGADKYFSYLLLCLYLSFSFLLSIFFSGNMRDREKKHKGKNVMKAKGRGGDKKISTNKIMILNHESKLLLEK